MQDFDLEHYVVTAEEWGADMLPPKAFSAEEIQKLLLEDMTWLCRRLTEMFEIVCSSMYNYDRFKFDDSKKYYIVVDTDSGKWYVAC